MFPTIRLIGAGATPAEIEHLEARHEAASPEEQESLLERLRGIAEGGLREWLDELRAAGTFGDVPAPEPEPAAADDVEVTEATEQPAHPEPADDEPTGNDADQPTVAAPASAPKPRAPRKPAKA